MDAKAELRRAAGQRRDALGDRDTRSARILERVGGLPEYRAASLVVSYVGVRSEVATRALLERRLSDQQPTAVVFRAGDELGMARIQDLHELGEASFGLWEPGPTVRDDPARLCGPAQADLYLVPGLAFDERGGRLGYGRGYYDRLLARAGGEATFMALAFEDQLVPQVPTASHDVPVHLIVTEDRVIRTA